MMRRKLTAFLGVIVVVLSTFFPLPDAEAMQRCELVELRPGYPGYRGFITGVDGIGDHECLEDLEAEDPFFSKSTEDLQNLDAARTLGLRGGPEVWTWENWLMIEAERGLPPTCYYCAFSGAEQRAEPRGTDVQRDDVRLLLGEIGGYTIFENWKRNNPAAPSYTAYQLSDYELRAIATVFYGDLNAEEILEVSEEILNNFFLSEQAHRLDTRQMWDLMIERGGYFDVPGGVTQDDEFFILAIGLSAMERFIGEQNVTHLAGKLLSAEDDWRDDLADGEFDGSFTEYLRAIDAQDWY